MSEVSTGEVTTARRTTPRSILAALFWLLACLAILVGGVTLWAHQTVLTANGWGTIVAGIASDEEVIAATSERLVDRVSESLDISEQGRRDPARRHEPAGRRHHRAVQQRVADGSPRSPPPSPSRMPSCRANELAHEAAMKVIRGGDSEALTSLDGAITLNVFPLIEGVLVGLQDAGLIDESREIPDLSELRAQPRARGPPGERCWGASCPMTSAPSRSSSRTAWPPSRRRCAPSTSSPSRSCVLAVLFVALALWLSARRLRMMVWLAIGSIIALLLGRGIDAPRHRGRHRDAARRRERHHRHRRRGQLGRFAALVHLPAHRRGPRRGRRGRPGGAARGDRRRSWRSRMGCATGCARARAPSPTWASASWPSWSSGTWAGRTSRSLAGGPRRPRAHRGQRHRRSRTRHRRGCLVAG